MRTWLGTIQVSRSRVAAFYYSAAMLCCCGRTAAPTAADLIARMVASLLEGGMPDLDDCMLVHCAIAHGADIYQPLNLQGIMQGADIGVRGRQGGGARGRHLPATQPTGGRT